MRKRRGGEEEEEGDEEEHKEEEREEGWSPRVIPPPGHHDGVNVNSDLHVSGALGSEGVDELPQALGIRVVQDRQAGLKHTGLGSHARVEQVRRSVRSLPLTTLESIWLKLDVPKMLSSTSCWTLAPTHRKRWRPVSRR